MKDALQYRFMEPGEETEVCDLVLRVFDQFIAPDYAEEGVQEFRRYVQPDLLPLRSRANHFVLVAVAQEGIAGMIEMRDCDHVSLLFVDEGFQRRGIARELLRRSLEICLRRRPEVREISVNSAPRSVHAYEGLSFRLEGPERVTNGIRFTPMVLRLPT